ncbi:MAG: hypothetical protein HY825_17790 [Acidobacteria bacterium]|nr:hypothetical protein [Acidobacteriota bacterium]
MDDDRRLRVEIWEWRTCLCRKSQFVLVTDAADGSVVDYQNAGHGWDVVLVLGNE